MRDTTALPLFGPYIVPGGVEDQKGTNLLSLCSDLYSIAINSNLSLT